MEGGRGMCASPSCVEAGCSTSDAPLVSLQPSSHVVGAGK